MSKAARGPAGIFRDGIPYYWRQLNSRARQHKKERWAGSRMRLLFSAGRLTGTGMDAADPGWRRLGAVFVEAGLVSEHDLVEALAEQERSGRRLGEILVARGLVSAAAVANALAEQHGSFLKTEHGFGTGLRTLMGRGSVPESGATQPEAPPLSLTQPPELALGDTPTVAVDSRASAKRLEAEPAAVPEEPQRSVAWTAALPPVAAGQASTSEQQHVRGLEAQGQPGPDLGHLLFVPTYQGYLLLQRSGTAPAVGDVLELPETPRARLIVAKLASSPLPQDRRVCAYLHNL